MKPATSRAYEYFQAIPQDNNTAFCYICSLIDSDKRSVAQENEFLDYKCWFPKPDEMRNIWSKALSGFANSGGGVLVWGIQTKSEGKYDLPTTLTYVEKPADFCSQLQDWIFRVTDPPVKNVECRSILGPDGKGFVVTFIPESNLRPHQCMVDAHKGLYYLRVGHNTDIASNSLLRLLFYPQLTHYVTLKCKTLDRRSEKELRIYNPGITTVTDIYVSFRQITITRPPAFKAFPLDLKEEPKAFEREQTENQDPRRATLIGLRSLHPGQYVRIGYVNLEPNEIDIDSIILLANISAKDMIPTYFLIEYDKDAWICREHSEYSTMMEYIKNKYKRADIDNL